MELNYRHSESTVKPLVVEAVQNSVYIRKNLTSEKRKMDTGTAITYWTYDEACLSQSEFNSYVAELTVINAFNSENSISKIIENMGTSDDNQIILMEALADLYDAVTKK